MRPDVHPATADDRDVVAGALARAFADDPLMAWLIPGEADRRARLPRQFARLYDECTVGCMRWTTHDGEAATLWHGPEERPASGPLARLQERWAWWRILGPATARGGALWEQVQRTRLPEPHWYLGIAGCDPSAQGTGRGGAVIRAGLRRADADRLRTCLETATRSNVSLYRRFGFAVTDEWRVGDGPPVWSMVRPAGG